MKRVDNAYRSSINASRSEEIPETTRARRSVGEVRLFCLDREPFSVEASA